jgi:Peptidase M15
MADKFRGNKRAMNRFVLFTFLCLVLAFTGCGAPERPKAPDNKLYQQWLAQKDHQAQTKELQLYLKAEGVGDVIPLHQLLRSDVKWKQCKAEPFAVPPKAQWPHIVPALKLIRDAVIPVLGPVEALSVYRGPTINACIKGAHQSRHLQFHAIDMQPVRTITREEMIVKLCALHAQKGKALNMGLGIYRAQRFHIDAYGYRGWGYNYKGASFPCFRVRTSNICNTHVALQHILR